MIRLSFALLCALGATSVSSAPLSQRLPEEVGLYLRIPSVLGMFADGQGNRSLSKAMAHPAHQQALQRLRTAISDLDDLPPEAQAVIKLLVAEQIAPVEIAMIAENGLVGPSSPFLVRTQVRANDPSFNKRFDSLLAAQMMQSTPYQYDAKTGELNLLLGMAANQDRLKQAQSMFNSKSSVSKSFNQAQAQLDSTGTGFLLWMDTQAVAPLLGMAAMGGDAAQVELVKALQSTDAIAMGAGTIERAGKTSGRFGIDFYFDSKQMPAWTRYINTAPRNYDFSMAGTSRWAALLTLPTSSRELDAMIADADQARATRVKTADQDADAEPEKTLAELINTKVLDDISGRQLLEALGPEMAIFSDEAGDFAALRVRNPAVFKKAMAAFAKRGAYEQRDGIHHLQIDAGKLLEDFKAEDDKAEPDASLAFLSRVNNSSMYWYQEGSWLIMSSVPQALRDRKALRKKLSSAQWKNYGGDQNSQLFSIFTRTEHMPRQFWYAYLSSIDSIAHIAKLDLDIGQLPSALELGLAKEGIAGLSVDYTPNRLGFGMHYDASPADALSSGGIGTLATVSILAAIALPAYQDYTVRAKVTSAYIGVASARVELTEAYLTEGKLPKAMVFDSEEGTTLTWTGSVLNLEFTDAYAEQKLRGQTLSIEVTASEDGLDFQCGNRSERAAELTTVEAKWLPIECRE
jgi:hypothetical protein